MLKTYNEIQEAARNHGGGTIAVAGAEGKAVLEAVKIAKTTGVMSPVLVGDRIKIEALAQEVDFPLDQVEIVDLKDEAEIAEKTVELVHNGQADGLMKGKVSTPALLKSVLNKKFNLRTDRLLSHMALLEIPVYHKLVVITDGGMIIQPTLEQKVGILKNGLDVIRKLGVEQPKVAVLAAIEKINPDMEETGHAQELAKMAEKGEFGNAIVEGPLAIDVAFSTEAARIKGIESRVAGDPDLLLMPNISSGNIFAKGLWHLAQAKIGGLVVGARKPIILLSRSDNAETKLNSIALACVAS